MAGFNKIAQAMGPSTAYITYTTPQPTRRPRRGRHTLRTSETQCRATQLVPLYDRLFPGEPVALDTEMLNHVLADETRHKAVGRVSVTNISGETVLDVYVYYPDDAFELQFFDPPRFGVEADDLLSSNGAVPIETAVGWLRKICSGRDVIMHAKYSDLNAFGQYASEIFGRSTVHDTQDFYGVRKLADLALAKLNKTIQADVHSSTEDAQVTGELWVLYTGYDRDAEFAKYMWGDQVPGQNRQKASKDGKKNATQEPLAANAGFTAAGAWAKPIPKSKHVQPGPSNMTVNKQPGPSNMTVINYGTMILGPSGQGKQTVTVAQQQAQSQVPAQPAKGGVKSWASVAATKPQKKQQQPRVPEVW
ncbi:hypothetical protein CB0940_09359 [Cercospora beticola]|uniref:Exonuclease domain-containing protein n=1 Tax=Cercospora beticola TaxID=122368 RepID=A0A2G5HI47_CERBT|nr:hypothetical protein CB0940_09359 [Cercospora beticola]PIA91882.1 hypothetical protein CB0940_09359 [Cercospora beticola]WPB06326.1 hypothetical protein RHO25_010983 [Cercospora beticola]